MTRPSTNNMLDALSAKRFYLTPTHDCSYFDQRKAQTLFLDPHDLHEPDTYAALTRFGFRRSGSHLYRPNCESCNACVPSRIPVERFRYSRRFRRILKKNEDLTVRLETAAYSHRNYQLYKRYIEQRHEGGDMYPPSPEQFRTFLLATWSSTRFLCAYLDRTLVAVATTDFMADGLSAIYTFFDPDLEARSLGVFSILKQIEMCQKQGLAHLYLGYWIRDCVKMSYKTEYRPIELFIDQRWVEG